MDATVNLLSVWDWIVIAIYGLVMLGVGWYYSKRNKDIKDYMLGGRQMKPWAVGLSLFATLFSAITYLSLPGEMIKNGPMYWFMLLAFPLVYYVVAWWLIPVIMKQPVSSAYELLEIKIGLSVRMLGSVLFLLLRLIWMAVIIYMVAEKIIIPMMGWSEETALWVSLAIGAITIVYTSMGGLRGVVFTDVMQTFILFFGALLALYLISRDMGGVSGWWPTTWSENWAGWTFFDTKARVSFLTAIWGMFAWYVCTAGSDQMAIQRYLSTRDAQAARKMYLASLVSNFVVLALLGVLGLALLAFFQKHSLLLSPGRSITQEADLLLPRFIVTGLPGGLSGLIFAGLMAAAMSSLSSGVNSSCLVISRDFLARFRKTEMSSKDEMMLAKKISLLIGLFVVLLSLLVGHVKGNLLELTYKTVNLLTGPLFVPFFIALFIKSANERATFIGTLAAVLASSLISFSLEIFGTAVSFLWMIPVSFVVGVGSSLVLGWIFNKKNNDRKKRK